MILAALSCNLLVETSRNAKSLPGPGAKAFGFTDEETFAGVSRIAQLTGSGSEAGNRFRALTTGLTRQGLADDLKGQGLDAVIKNIVDRGFTKEELTTFLGSTEAEAAFSVLRDREALRKRIGKIEKAQRDNLANQTIVNAIQDRVLAAGVLRRRAAAGRVLVQEEDAIRQNLADADQDAAFTFDREFAGAGRAFVNDQVRGFINVLNPSGGEQAMQQLIEETRQTNQLLQEQNSNLSGLVGTRQE